MLQQIDAAKDSGGELDSDVARARREDLLRELVSAGDLHTRRVVEAMRRVPRHQFVPGATLAQAYGNHPFPIGHRQTISQPTVVAAMTEALELEGSERVLEIGTGSGYQAAILSCLVREVYSIELVPELAEEAAARLSRLGYANVRVRIGDGYFGWPEEAPFDRVLLTAAPAGLPRALAKQLAAHGIMVAPIGPPSSWQSLVRYRRDDTRLVAEDLGSVRFVPMVP